MKKSEPLIVNLFMIFCLLGDPSLAAAQTGIHRSFLLSGFTPCSIFNDQALALHAMAMRLYANQIRILVF